MQACVPYPLVVRTPPGQDFVDVDPVGAQLVRENSHQHPQRRIRARVRRDARTTVMAVTGPHHDDVPAAPPLQVGDSQPRAVMGPTGSDRASTTPPFQRHIFVTG